VVPVLDGGVAEGVHAARAYVAVGVSDAGVVDQDVEPAELLGGGPDRRAGLAVVGEVGRVRGEGRPRIELLGQVLELVDAAADRDDLCSLGEEPFGDGPADALAGAGDHGDFALQSAHLDS